MTDRMMASSLQSMLISGDGVLTCPLEKFAEAFADRFRGFVHLVSQHESPSEMKWNICCMLEATDVQTIAEIKDYLEANFPSHSGRFQIEGSVYQLFDVIPNVFFVVNLSFDEVSRVEVQYVDRYGRTRKSRLLTSVNEGELAEPPIPGPVFDAGLRCPNGTGDYVDLEGRQLSPTDFRLLDVANGND